MAEVGNDNFLDYEGLTAYDEQIKDYIDDKIVSAGNVPAGGTTGQVLKKKSNTDYDVEWGEGGGASSSSISITNSTNDLTGETVTIKLSGAVVTTVTVGDIVPVSTLGNYVIECGVYSVNVAVIAFGTSYTADLSTANSWQMWVDASGLDHTDYADLSEVLADEKAIRRLMTIHASVDFLAQSNKNATLINTIINNDYCAKWINLRDYALDTLYANSNIASLMDTADKYFYGEWTITDNTTTPPTWGAKGNVPVMTSNTAPYGEAISSSVYSTKYPYYAFDGSTSTSFEGVNITTSGIFLGYKFTNPVNVKKIFHQCGTGATCTIKLQYSDDGSTWINTTTTYSISIADDPGKEINVDADYGYHLCWRIYLTATTASTGMGTGTLQFYGRELRVSVPKMTSNTAPYGEVFSSNNKSDAWKEFEDNASADTHFAGGQGTNTNISGYIGYKFNTPTKIFHTYIKTADSSYFKFDNTIYIEYSNDGVDYIVADTYSITASQYRQGRYLNITNSASAPYWRLRMVGANYQSGTPYTLCTLGILRFYGLDYSEYDWDTDNPRHYIYDHGVELEEIYTHSDGNTGVFTKELDQIVAVDSSTSDNAWISIKDKIDTTSYILARWCIGNKFNKSGAFYLGAGSGYDNFASYARADITSDYLPNDLSLDISSVNGECLIASGISIPGTGTLSIKEMWLE